MRTTFTHTILTHAFIPMVLELYEIWCMNGMKCTRSYAKYTQSYMHTIFIHTIFIHAFTPVVHEWYEMHTKLREMHASHVCNGAMHT